MDLQRKREFSWILYDCGNSAYSIAITTALFPVYFGMFKVGEAMDLGYFNSIASVIVAILAPVMGTIADYRDRKKRFFLFFFLLGVVFTAAVSFVPKGNWQMLGVFYILNSVGFAAANIFYDAFLVDVTVDERMDLVSSKGYAYGYIASIIPFGISLGIIAMMGMSNIQGYRIGFLITALWWGLLTIPMLRHVNQRYYIEPEPHVFRNSFSRILKTLKETRRYPVVFLFLIAYFFYIDGVGTIIKMVVPYAQSVMGETLDTFLLLGYLLVIQIIAFPFALVYGWASKRYDTLKLIRFAILTYIVAVIFSYFMSKIWHIFVLGFFIASAQGGIQALSRSYFAKIIPKENSNEFFGFYNIFGKFASIFGPLIMAVIQDITGVARYSILGILPLFLIGYVLTHRLPSDTDQVNKEAVG